MSALSTTGGGGTSAQSKPTAAKQKFQKLDINSLYCANRNESSEPSSVKSQLSRKHGMQSLGKVPSARRPPANLPSLKTEIGQDSNANPVSGPTPVTTTTCTTQATTTTTSTAAAVATGPAGWVSLPPPSSPHFRTEFPSLEAAAQPSHRSADHLTPTQLRPQTEGNWTFGGTAAQCQENTNPAAKTTSATTAQQQGFGAILPSFLMTGSNSGGLGLGSITTLRDTRSGNSGPRPQPRPPVTPRAVEVLTARPILREDQISSLDDISRDAGWAQNDDIDYDQKLDFSDGESTPTLPPSKNNKSSNRVSSEKDNVKMYEPGDEDQLWAERRQKQHNEVAQAVARARQLKEEEQRRQMKDSNMKLQSQHYSNKNEKDIEYNNNRDVNTKAKISGRDSKERLESKEKEWNELHSRDIREKEILNDNRQSQDNRNETNSRYDNRDQNMNKDKNFNEKNKVDDDKIRDKERVDNRDRYERDRFGRERERDRIDRDRNRDYRDRDYGRERDQNSGYSKNFQTNIPPRFQKQNRPQDDQHKWTFPVKPANRRQEESYNAPRRTSQSGRRSYSRDYSDREDDIKKDKESGQWRSEMQDFDKSGPDQERSRDVQNEHRSQKSFEVPDQSKTHEAKSSAADKLNEVFERKSIESVEHKDNKSERRVTPPSNVLRRDTSEKDIGKASWVEIINQDEQNASQNQTEVPRDDRSKNSVLLEQEKNVMQIHPINKQHSSNIVHSSNESSRLDDNFNKNAQQSSVSLNKSQSNLQQTSLMPQKIPVSDSCSITFNENKTVEKPHNITETKSEIKYGNVKSEFDTITSKSATETTISTIKNNDNIALDSLSDSLKWSIDKKIDSDKLNKDPVERKSSGSGSERKGRSFGAGSIYNRGWGSKESRGRRLNRNSQSNNRASESDGSTESSQNPDRRDRRKNHRSPRVHKKSEKIDEPNSAQSTDLFGPKETLENKESFAPRGQPSRRGRGGFQGTTRPPAPAKRLAGYGPPNTKSPFGQANRAVKDNDEAKEKSQFGDKARVKSRIPPSVNRGKESRNRGFGGPPSGEDENWETTSEHSEGGNVMHYRRSGSRQTTHASKLVRNHNSRQNNARGQSGIKEFSDDGKASQTVDAVNDLKAGVKKEECVDDGFQEVRNKRNVKDLKTASSKEDISIASKQTRSHSNHSGGRNDSLPRNSNDKVSSRNAPSTSCKNGSQYPERSRQVNLPPRLMKQRQKQMSIAVSFSAETGAAPPPPAVNAWDKPISQTLRGTNLEESTDESKTGLGNQRNATVEIQEIKVAATACSITADKIGVLDGTTPPVKTLIFENTNFKTTPPADALKSKYQPVASVVKPQEELPSEMEARNLTFNGEVRMPPRSIQELITESGRKASEGENTLGLQMAFDTNQKTEDSSDMKLDFAFDSDLSQLTEDKTAKSLGLPRAPHISTSNTISPLAADLNLKIASVKKVWEMPAVAENTEELQFANFEEANTETGAPPNVCKVKPTQQLQSPPPQHYNHVGYQGGYGGLSVPSPPAVLFNSTQQLLSSSQQLQQQGGLYGAFLDQSRGQFGGFPATPYAAGTATPYNYQPPPDMFQSLPNQYRMAAAAAAASGGAAFGQSGQLANSPNTVLISSTSNSLMSATVKPSTQQIGAIGSKGAGVGAYQQQYVGYSASEAAAAYSLSGLLPARAAPHAPATSYYTPYQPPAPPAPHAPHAPPAYPMQFPQAPQSAPTFPSQFLSSQLQVAAAVQQMQQQYRAPMQQQFGTRPPQQLKSPLHEAGAQLDAGSPKPSKPHNPPHSPPHHKYHHHHQQQQMMSNMNVCRNGAGVGGARGPCPRYPAPIQRPPAPRAHPAPHAPHAPHPRHNLYYHHQHPRTGGGGGGSERPAEVAPEAPRVAAEDKPLAAAAEAAPAPQPPAEIKAD